MIKELGDIFFESLLAADHSGSQVVKMFDNPPLCESCPDLVEVVSPWVNAVREGSLNPEYTKELISHEVNKYKSGLLFKKESNNNSKQNKELFQV